MFPFKVSKLPIYFVVVLYLFNLSGCLDGVIKPEEWVFWQDKMALSRNGAKAKSSRYHHRVLSGKHETFNADSASNAVDEKEQADDLYKIIKWLNDCKDFIEEYKKALEDYMKNVFGPWELRPGTNGYMFKLDGEANGCLYLTRFNIDRKCDAFKNIDKLERHLRDLYNLNKYKNVSRQHRQADPLRTNSIYEPINNNLRNNLEIIGSLIEDKSLDLSFDSIPKSVLKLCKKKLDQGREFMDYMSFGKLTYKELLSNIGSWSTGTENMLNEFLKYITSLDTLQGEIKEVLDIVLTNTSTSLKDFSIRNGDKFKTLITNIISFNSLEGYYDSSKTSDSKMLKLHDVFDRLTKLSNEIGDQKRDMSHVKTWDICVSELSKQFFDYPKHYSKCYEQCLQARSILHMSTLLDDVDTECKRGTNLAGIKDLISRDKNDIRNDMGKIPRIQALSSALKNVNRENLRFDNQKFENRIKFICDLEEFNNSDDINPIISHIKNKYDEFKN